MHKENGISMNWPAAPGAAELLVDDIARTTRELARTGAAVPEVALDRKAIPDRDAAPPRVRLDPDALRHHARRVAERRAHEGYVCPDNYMNLIPVSPAEAFFAWRVQPAWIDETLRRKGNLAAGAQLTIRVYDISCILFNGFNAHRMRDISVEHRSGERLMPLPVAGTTQIAEIGFLLPNKEFVPAARSPAVAFAPTTTSGRQDCSALYVDDGLTPEPVASPWEGAEYLRERAKPRLRSDLRVAILSFESMATGHQGAVAAFVSNLAGALCSNGQRAEVFVAARDHVERDFEVDGVRYHALRLDDADTPVASALSFARSLEARLRDLPPFDLFHLQDWMTGLAPWLGTRPAVLAMTSLECTRRSGAPVTDASKQIEGLERDVAHSVECVVVPGWLREVAVKDLGVDPSRIHAFPLDGRPIDEWNAPLELGAAKTRVGLQAFDRMLLFVGPLEEGAGPDLVVEALPPVLSRTPSARVVFVGCGGMRDRLAGRARQLGIEHAVRLVGHFELPALVPLLRASEALLLPSRRRIANDDAVVGLARRAGRAVLATHSGPSHAVQHERDGLLVYDNPPSVVWGMSRLLEDAGHTEQMGRNGLASGAGTTLNALGRTYADLCAEVFCELTEAAQASKAGRTREGERN